MGHTHSRNSVHLAIKTTAVSMVILLAAGCSDSDSLPSTTDNQHNTAPEVSNEAPKGDDTTKIPEDAGNNSPSGGIGGGNTDVDSGKDTGSESGSEGSDTESNTDTDSGSESGSDSGSEGNDNTGSGEGTPEGDGNETPPENGDNADAAGLTYEFERAVPEQGHIGPKPNEEIIGRTFKLNIFSPTADGTGKEDVTDKVTWTAIQEQCGNISCFKVTVADEDKEIIGNRVKGTHTGRFTLVAELNGLVTPEIEFINGDKLEVCPTGQKSIDGQPCLAVVEQTFDTGKTVMYTEPPRDMVMEQIWYKEDASLENTGYSYTSFVSVDGENYAQMVNQGLDALNTGGDFGQHDRLCRDLKEMEFNGRDDWRRPYAHELELMSKDYVAGVNGWPQGEYAAANFTAGTPVKIAYVNMATGRTLYRTTDVSSSPVCASGLPW